ncbi:MAG: ATP-grasp domain-containing protein, partial [Candidatus Bathyarchaeota archaeon]|nr:ATP-grasp domain-containing protein [Candidatus Bathyarchaeota archaeon]
MSKLQAQNLLVVGIDAAAVARSAAKAGYTVFAADHFGDLDLRESCRKNLSIKVQRPGESCGHLATEFSPETLLELAKNLQQEHQIDAAILASGFEDSRQVLTQLHETVPIIGNAPSTIEMVSDKARLSKELKKLGIPYPRTESGKTSGDIERAAKDIGYPVIIKPISGFGGSGVRVLKSKSELHSFLRPKNLSDGGVVIQEFIPGIN